METPFTVGPPSTARGAVLFTFTVTDELAVTPVTCVTAVMRAWVAAVTCGAVNRPDTEMVPMLLLQLTRVVLAPLARAMHWLLCRGWMTLGEQLTEMAVTGVTVTVAEPVFVASWVDVALTVTAVLAVTDSAVKTPFTSTLPAEAPHVTVVAKLPVPVTVAVQELVWPDCSEVGVHDTVTAVMAALLEPPPQAIIPRSDNKAKIRTRVRKPFPPDPARAASVLQMNILTINLSHEHRAGGFVSSGAEPGLGLASQFSRTVIFAGSGSEASRRIRIQGFELAPDPPRAG